MNDSLSIHLHGDPGPAALDDTAARIAYEAAGYVNWDRQREETKDIHRRVAAAVQALAATRIEALTAEVGRLREAHQQVVSGRISGEPNNHRDTLAIVRQISRTALENSDER